MFRALVGRVKNIKLGPHDTIRKVLTCRWLRCPHIVHLDFICMNYDQKKGWETKFENLTANRKSFESKGQIRFDWGVLYIVENIFMRAIIL